MVIGGSILTLLGFGVLHLYRPDFLNIFFDQRVEIWMTRIAGIALIAGPICILPYVIRVILSKQSIVYATSRHVKNRAEEILSSLELLKVQAAKEALSPEQLKLLTQAENACLKLVGSIGVVLSSDGSETGSPDFSEQVKKELQ